MAVLNLSLTNFQRAFQQLNFSETEIDSIFRIASGVLHLGNIKFTGEDRVC